jgi:hypothetical protein
MNIRLEELKMRREDEYMAIRKWEGAAAEAKARASDLAAQLGQPLDPLPAPIATNAESLVEILRIMSDPVAFKKHAKELADATSACNEARAKAEAAIAESHRVLADHNKQIKKAKADHQIKCQDAWSQIEARDAESKAKADELRVGLEEVARQKADFDRRAALIRQAGLD